MVAGQREYGGQDGTWAEQPWEERRTADSQNSQPEDGTDLKLPTRTHMQTGNDRQRETEDDHVKYQARPDLRIPHDSWIEPPNILSTGCTGQDKSPRIALQCNYL